MDELLAVIGGIDGCCARSFSVQQRIAKLFLLACTATCVLQIGMLAQFAEEPGAGFAHACFLPVAEALGCAVCCAQRRSCDAQRRDAVCMRAVMRYAMPQRLWLWLHCL
eukprot:498646-Rhodomonas_salina.1